MDPFPLKGIKSTSFGLKFCSVWPELMLVEQLVDLCAWLVSSITSKLTRGQHAVSKLSVLGFNSLTTMSFQGSKECDNTINDGVPSLTALTCLGHFALSWRGQTWRSAADRGYKRTEAWASLNEITVHGICQRTSCLSPAADKQAKNRDKIVEDKEGEEGGKTWSRDGRKAKTDGGADFAETTAQVATHRPRSHWLHAFLAP